MHTILETVQRTYAHEPLFKNAVTELLSSVLPYLEEKGATEEEYARLLRMLIPERLIAFRVTWEDDAGKFQVNTGYRIQFNSALGPYKGGLRFDPSVNTDVLKFLGFEQIFKNALTGLPLGAGKGGSDFDPKGKSDKEIWRFATAFMTELVRHIGPHTDVPAGDIGVGGREIGYLFGAYKRLQNKGEGVLTGKGVGYGGSLIRTEATGYGAVYFMKEMLGHAGKDIAGMRALISGSGNVATHVAEKLRQEGALPLTLSDREGYIMSEDGLSDEVIKSVRLLKERHGSLKDMTLPPGVTYHTGKVWGAHEAELAIPSATQNELTLDDAQKLTAQGVILVGEGANMPSTLDAIHYLETQGVLFGPAKAVNAGGVAVSGLEMSQNASHDSWTREDVDARLRTIMKQIHATCVAYGNEGDRINYLKGANIGGFVRVFEAMKHLGW